MLFDFHWPWFVLLLPLPWLVWRLWPLSSRAEGPSGLSLLHPAIARLSEAFGGGRPRLGAIARLKGVLMVLTWVGLVGAMMRPQWLEEHTEVRTRGYDLVIAVDTSRSMEALDFTVNGRHVSRMAVVKGVVGRFIEARQGDRIGLIIFGDQAFVLSPLTLDVEAVRSLLDQVVPRMAGDGTAIGDAVALGVKKLRERPPGSRVLVLVTDGENTSGSLPPRLAAALAAREGVRIYSIGVGRKGLVPFMEDGRLTQQRMEIDEDLLRGLALATGGAFFQATDTHALEEIYRRIDALEKTEAVARSTWIPHPLFRWPLALALLSLFALGWFRDGRLSVTS